MTEEMEMVPHYSEDARSFTLVLRTLGPTPFRKEEIAAALQAYAELLLDNNEDEYPN